MNDSTSTQLKAIVERAVRPVRASTSRKRKIREELLAHVSGVFEEEAAKLGDDRAALERTAQRFGDPAEVTTQMQESIPASDAIARFWEGDPGESLLRGALRVAWVTGVLVLPICAIALLTATWLSASAREDVVVFVAGLVFLPVWLFAIAFLTHGMEKSLHCAEPIRDWPHVSLRKSLRRAWAVPAVRIALIVGCSCFLALLSVQALIWPVPAEEWVPWVLLTTGVLYSGDLAATSVLVAWVMVQTADERRRYHEEWSRLPV